MAYAYKLVTQKMTSRNNTKWEIGKVVEIAKELQSPNLCSSGMLHCYKSPELAVFMNSIHANISSPRLFRIRCSKIVADDGTKQGCYKQTLIKELELPVISLEQRIEIAIRCALVVYKEEKFVLWATNWLNGTDRTRKAAAAADAAATAADAAYAATAAAYAAYAATYATYAAADVAATYAAYAAYAAANTATYAAASAAANAASKSISFSLTQIIKSVIYK